MSEPESPPVQHLRYTDGVWCGLALLMTAVIYHRIVSGWVLAGGDLNTYFYPYWATVVRALQSASLPLWNPDLFAGAPLLANSQAGVFYPLNWLCWLGSLMAGGSLESITRVLHLSVVLHLELAVLTVFILARKLRMSAPAAAVAALCYAGSGFLGVHTEHLNQLQALAWFPLLLLPLGETSENHRMVRPGVILAMVMILLAGHSQIAFIALMMLGFFVVLRLFVNGHWRDGRSWLRSLVYWLPLALAACIAMVQLVPTFELSQLSARSGGLPWREAVSFSLRPRDALLAWLPTYLRAPQLPESVIGFGITGLVFAAAGVVSIWRTKNRYGWIVIFLTIAGLIMALGGYNPLYLLLVRAGMPGLTHFRAPARFLAISVLSVSLLAGYGLDNVRAWLDSLISRKTVYFVISLILAVATGVELLFSAGELPHADATLSRAYTDFRPATAHLVAASAESRAAYGVAPRFLGITQTLFEVGDKAEIEGIYAHMLSPDALMAYLVAAKQREVLVPNLPMVFDVPAADGYDGGLLPTRYFQQFSRLMLPEGTLDGRLRENLHAVPDSRWLDLLNVRYVITDKTADAWVDDVFYDRQFEHVLVPDATLSPGWLPDNYTATGVRILVENGQVNVRVHFEDGRTVDTALNPVGTPAVLQVSWDAGTVTALSLSAVGQPVILNGITLVDARNGSFYPLVLSADYRLAHSGDVKIYERLTASPRAWVVGACEAYINEDMAFEAMQLPAFNPHQQVVLTNAICRTDAVLANAPGQVNVIAYTPDGLVLDVDVSEPGYLVLADAWYPGWQAVIAPQDTPSSRRTVAIERADLFLRAIYLDPGAWQITFLYQPESLWIGAALSGVGLSVFILYAVWWRRQNRAAYAAPLS